MQGKIGMWLDGVGFAPPLLDKTKSKIADHVGFAVASLDESLRFWVDGLGARLLRTGEMEGEFLGQVTGAHGARVRLAIVSLADQTIELLEYQGLDRPNAPAKPFDPGFAHLALVVDDIDALLARIAAYGWKAQGTPQPIASGARAGTREQRGVSAGSLRSAGAGFLWAEGREQ